MPIEEVVETVRSRVPNLTSGIELPEDFDTRAAEKLSDAIPNWRGELKQKTGALELPQEHLKEAIDKIIVDRLAELMGPEHREKLEDFVSAYNLGDYEQYEIPKDAANIIYQAYHRSLLQKKEEDIADVLLGTDRNKKAKA